MKSSRHTPVPGMPARFGPWQGDETAGSSPESDENSHIYQMFE